MTAAERAVRHLDRAETLLTDPTTRRALTERAMQALAAHMSRVESEERELAALLARERVLQLYGQQPGRTDGAFQLALAAWHRAEQALVECRRARRDAETFEVTP